MTLFSRKRVAAIDVGTNSVHMIIAERRAREMRIVDRQKEMVQLGAGLDEECRLTAEAIERGVAAMRRIAEVVRGWNVQEIVAVGTSAVRAARNRGKFLRRIKDETGIDVRILTGGEEAAYIFRAVRSVVDLEDHTALCIDIGGGSAELIAGAAHEIFVAESLPLGSLTMSRRFALQDRPRRADVAACRRHIRKQLEDVEERIGHLAPDLFIGTSGTVLALADVVVPGRDRRRLVSRTLDREALDAVVRRLCATTAAQRMAELGMDEVRANSIIGGALVLQETMRAFSIESLLACPVAMREGLIERKTAKRGAASIRRGAALALAERSESDLPHAKHVARLALRIFDQSIALHGLAREEREVLEHAALLHEVGMHVSDRAYHKHTYYLVRHAELSGFTEGELILIANVARYHRKATPRDDHPNLGELTPEQRAAVQKLAAILRIAVALDRGHRQLVRDVGVQLKKRAVHFPVAVRADAAAELADAAKRARYFEQLFATRVRFDVQ